MRASLPSTPSKDDRNILAFSERLSPGQRPFYVPVQPEPDFEPLQCFPNVFRKVERSAGSIVHGWEISQEPKVHLEAQFHAVWKSPGGDCVDVTPQVISQSPILFLIDARRTYTGTIVLDERFTLGDTVLVHRYWALRDERMAIMTEMQVAGFPRGHPAYRQRLIPLQTEIETIRERLKDAG